MKTNSRLFGLTSIRARVLLLLGASFVIVLLVAGGRAFERRAADIAISKERLLAQAELITATRIPALTDTQRLLGLLVRTQDIEAIGRGPRCAGLLAGFIRDDPRIADIFIVQTDGTVVCGRHAADGSVDVSGRDYFQPALDQPGPVIGGAHAGRVDGGWILPFAQRYRSAGGNVEGLLVVALDLGWLNGEFSRGSYPSQAYLGLVDANGNLLARHPDPERRVGTSASDSPAFKTIVAEGGTGIVESASLDGITRLFAHKEFARTASGPIHFWIGLPSDQVTETADRQFLSTIAMVLALMFVTMSAAWAGSERWLMRPIQVINDTAHRLGRGDFLARTGLPAGQDEISRLAQVFDEMATSLASESERLRLTRALEVLSQVNRVLVHATSEAQHLQDVCRIIVEVGGYRMAWVGFAEDDQEKTIRPVAQYGHADGYLERVRITWEDSPRGRGPTGTAVRTGIPQVNQNFETNPLLAPWREEALRRGYRSSTALPLKSESKVFGALTVYSERQDAFNPQELRLIEELAGDLAFGIMARRLRLAHEQTLERLQQTLEATVEAVATTVEYRDPYTAGHQRRVAQLATAIAAKMGIPEQDIRGIHLAGVVHDIGKIKVPKEILTKSSQLSDAEYRLVREHPGAGYDILKNIDFPWPIAEMVRQHHERMDGSGYPRGLKGDDILIGARILAVADVVEAMSLNRPYRKSPGLAAALGEITDRRGLAYDAAVVDACMAVFRTGGFSFDQPLDVPETV